MKKIINFLSQSALKKGLLPDPVIRYGIRQLLKEKSIAERKDGLEFTQAHFMKFMNHLRTGPIAVDTRKANEQHYEVPSAFFKLVLGKHLKYSSGYWREGVTTLDQSEEDMLNITCERADLSDGQNILELGCGWGSLSLFMAKKFPNSHIIGVSNSSTQKIFIDEQAQERGIKNLEIITADMNAFDIHRKFDRIVSVEMFEHMRNYDALLTKIAHFLKPQGKLFVHIFTHVDFAYFYESEGDEDWIGKYFFSGGIMPSDHMLLYFQDHFKIHDHWRVLGSHYQKTSEAWLQNMDANRDKIMPILKNTYGQKEAQQWWVYWRVFFMSCAELWGYKNGTEWIVSHYLFEKR